MPLDARFAAKAFLASDDPGALARELQSVLEARLRAGSAADVVSDMKALGHRLGQFDEDDGYEVWIAEYTGQRRLILDLRVATDDPGGAGDLPSVSVTFGPWPRAEPGPTCPSCKTEMRPTSIEVRATGHGMLNVPAIEVRCLLGDSAERTLHAGVSSERVAWAAFGCPTCGGLWCPKP